MIAINTNPRISAGDLDSDSDKSKPDISPDPKSQQGKKLGPNTKRAAVLRVFLERAQRGLNCFEAVSLAHDFVLRTTVSECLRYHGIAFNKRFEQVPGYNGSKVDCVRYSLTAEGAATARELLEPA